MNVVTVEDPREFAQRAEPVLLRDEARHNLMFGILSTLIERPDFYEQFHLTADVVPPSLARC